MPQIKSSFTLNSKYPLDIRNSFDTLAELKNPGILFDEGHITYCKETGKHYIYNSNHNSGTTGHFEEFSFEDMLVYNTKVSMKNEIDIENIALGKLAFCLEDGLIYFNTYGSTHDNTDPNTPTGYFKQLVSINEQDYTTWKKAEEIAKNVIENYDFGTTGLITYETLNDLKSVDPIKSKVEYGQLAFCKENEMHYYCSNDYNEDYGYFKLLSAHKVLKPTITNPSATINLMNYSTIKYDESHDCYIVEVNYQAPITGNFQLEGNMGWIDYSGFPDGRESIPYVDSIIWPDDTDEYTKSSLICSRDGMPIEIPTAIDLGNQEYHYNVYFKPGLDPKDSNYNILDDLKWNRNKIVRTTNTIKINGSKYWYASTTSNTDLEKQPIPYWCDEIMVECELVPTAYRDQEFKIPRELQHIYIQNSLSCQFVESDKNEWIESFDGIYYTYKYRKEELGNVGSRKIQIIY